MERAKAEAQHNSKLPDHARAEFALTQADQEDLRLREGAPVYLEPSD